MVTPVQKNSFSLISLTNHQLEIFIKHLVYGGAAVIINEFLLYCCVILIEAATAVWLMYLYILNTYFY